MARWALAHLVLSKRTMQSAGNMIAALAVAAVAYLGAAGELAARQAASSPMQPEPSVPALVIDLKRWRRARAGWVHSTKGFTYSGDVIQVGSGAVMVPHGHGRATVPGVGTYAGQWCAGWHHGEGEHLTADGSYSHRGKYKQGLAFGYGVASHANGWRYEGHFVKGYRHGQGKWTDIGGRVLEGQWHQNMFHGRGRAVLADGRILVGRFFKWKPALADGLFRGVMIDDVHGGVIRFNEWTSKRRTLIAQAIRRRPAVRRRQRDDNGDGSERGTLSKRTKITACSSS